MSIEIHPFTNQDYPEARRLWEETEGVGLSDADSRDGIELFLSRNPGLSFVAVERGRVVGTILVGHDGRRGHIHHLAVHAQNRKLGLARQLVQVGLAKLAEVGIQKCHLLVFQQNESGQAFWRAIGAEQRPALALYSLAIPSTQ
jgi:ribosomal protein S18 acetylase RimI-like enzyme